MLTVLIVMDDFTPVLTVFRALRDAPKPELLRLVVTMILVFPATLWLLTRTDPAIFRCLAAVMALFLLASQLLGLL